MGADSDPSFLKKKQTKKNQKTHTQKKQTKKNLHTNIFIEQCVSYIGHNFHDLTFTNSVSSHIVFLETYRIDFYHV